MRIVWNNEHSVFVAEFSDFQSDLEEVKKAGFRPLGTPPPWIWHAPPPGIKALNRLRDQKPKSGLVITETALQKYKPLQQQQVEKDNLRKQFKSAQKIAKKTEVCEDTRDTYIDTETGIICIVVKPSDTKFTWDHIKPSEPKEKCLACDCGLYLPLDGKTFCMFCEKELDTSTRTDVLSVC
jgi:hypothetical protein